MLKSYLFDRELEHKNKTKQIKNTLFIVMTCACDITDDSYCSVHAFPVSENDLFHGCSFCSFCSIIDSLLMRINVLFCIVWISCMSLSFCINWRSHCLESRLAIRC
eukprot:447374_1